MLGTRTEFGDELPVELKELKKLAVALDDIGKRELIYFLQSRTKGGISNEQVCVLVARDRQKKTFSGVLGRG